MTARETPAPLYFKLAPDESEATLYALAGDRDGYGPAAGLVADKKFKHLYGATPIGGAHNGGSVFAMTLGSY